MSEKGKGVCLCNVHRGLTCISNVKSCSWLRRKWNSSPVVISGAEDDEYQLTIDDVDSSLVFMYTPVTTEGTKGEPQYAITDYVKAGMSELLIHI